MPFYAILILNEGMLYWEIAYDGTDDGINNGGAFYPDLWERIESYNKRFSITED